MDSIAVSLNSSSSIDIHFSRTSTLLNSMFSDKYNRFILVEFEMDEISLKPIFLKSASSSIGADNPFKDVR